MLTQRQQVEVEIRKIVPEDLYVEWLNTPNPNLEMEKPNSVLAQAERDMNYQRLWSMIHRLKPFTPWETSRSV